MNTELLLKIKAAILAEPTKFNMSDWFNPDKDSPCGTAACIAGHAMAIKGECKTLKVAREKWFTEGPSIGSLLEVTYDQKEALCYVSAWPAQLAERYAAASSIGDREGMAKAAADRIDYFIATNGKD